MKLRLPSKLQAALIAALASVSITTLSTGAAHGAVTLTDIGTWTGYDEDTAAAVVGNTGAAENPIQYGTIYSGNQSWNTSWAHVVTVDTASLLSSNNDLTIYAVNMKDTGTNIGYAEGVKITGTGNTRTITMTSWSNASVGSVTKDLTQYGTLTFVMNHDWGNNGALVLKVYADGDFSTELMSATQGGQKFTNYSIYTAETGTTGGRDKFNNKDNHATLTADADVGSYTALGAGYVNGSTVSTQDLQTYYNNITVLQWNGTETSNNWNSTEANWLKWGKGDAMGFTVAGAQALFGKGEDRYKTVNVPGDANMSVSGVKVVDDYTFNMAGNLNAGKITIAEGTTLTRTGSGTLTGALSGAGTYSAPLNNNGTLAGVSLDSTWAGTIRVSNQTIQGGTWINNLAPRNNTWVEFVRFKGYDSTWSGQLNANIKLTSDGTANPAWELSAYASAWNTMVANGSWTGDGTFKTAGGIDTQMQAVEYKGNISGWTGRFEANTDGDRRVTFTSNATAVNADVVKTGGSKNFEVIVNTNAAFASGKQVKADTLTVNSNYTATFNGTTEIANGVTLNTGSSLTVGVTGSLTMGGTITFGGSPIVNNGTITLEEGFKLDLSGLTPTDDTYTVFSGTNTFDFTQISTSTDNITGIVTEGKVWTFNNNGTITFEEGSKYSWSGGIMGYWDYETANWNGGQPFAPHSNALFDSGAMVTLNAAVEAASLEVTSALTLFAAEGAGLTVPALKLGEDAELTSDTPIAGLQEITIGNGAVWTIQAQGQELNAAITYGDEDSTIEVEAGASARVTDAARAKSFMEGNYALTNRGTFELATSVQIANGTSIAMGGILQLDSGVTLTLSTGKNNQTTLANFSQIVLEGGTLASSSSMGTLHNVTVTENSAINFNDFPDMSGGQHTATTTLAGATDIAQNKTLTIFTKYKSNIVMDHLTGAGTLKLTTENRNDAGKTLVINSMEDFSGNLNLAPGSTGNKVAVTATVGPEDVSMGTLTLGNASASFTTTGEHSLTLTSLTTSGTVTLGTDTTVGAVTLNGSSSRLELGAGVSLALARNQLITNTGGGTIVMNNGSGITTWDSDNGHVRQLGNVLVKGIATINTYNGAWNAVTNIASLSGESVTDGESETAPTLKLQTSADVNFPTVYNLNGVGTFNGSIELSQLDDGERYLALNLNAVNGQNLALQLKGSTNGSSHIGIGLGADATVRGISSDDGEIAAADSQVIFSGAANTTNKQKFNNDDSVVRNLTIATQEGDNFSTRAKVQNNVNLIKTGAGIQALSVDTTTANKQFNGSVSAEKGTLNVLNAGSLAVKDVHIGEHAVFGVYSGATATASTEKEGSIAITEEHSLTVLEGATLNANLIMEAGSTLDVSYAQNSYGLIMGSSVTLKMGALLEDSKNGVESEDMNAFLFEYLSNNPYYYLYDSVEELYIQQGAAPKRYTELDFVNWLDFDMDASRIFANLNENTYALVYNWDTENTGRVALVMIPEPATGTLSLLALCALAARRRRK